MYALMEWDVEQKQPNRVYTRQEMDAARALIEREAARMAEQEGIEPRMDPYMWQVVANCSSELVRHQNRFTRLQNLHKRDQIEVLSDRFKVQLELFLFISGASKVVDSSYLTFSCKNLKFQVFWINSRFLRY